VTVLGAKSSANVVSTRLATKSSRPSGGRGGEGLSNNRAWSAQARRTKPTARLALRGSGAGQPRALLGLKPVPNEHAPMMIWISHNIAQTGNPPQQSEGYGNGFMTGYEKLWGLAS
jgi:hypothetical protein